MITISTDKCSACGLCARVCHESCLTLPGGIPHIDTRYCSTCTQCIAICPQGALSWDQAPAVAYYPPGLPSPAQLEELFKERRSVRSFRKKRIDRQLLEEIAGYGTYAPTHNFALRLIITDDEATINFLDQTLFTVIRRIYRIGYKYRIIDRLASLFGYAEEYHKAKPKMEQAMSRGQALASRPAAFIFIVGDKKVPLSEASAQYSLANMMYYAQVKGIGSCLWGNAPVFIDKSKAARSRLGIQKHERIYGALMMGYPAIKFSNKVMGKSLPIQWVSSLT